MLVKNVIVGLLGAGLSLSAKAQGCMKGVFTAEKYLTCLKAMPGATQVSTSCTAPTVLLSILPTSFKRSQQMFQLKTDRTRDDCHTPVPLTQVVARYVGGSYSVRVVVTDNGKGTASMKFGMESIDANNLDPAKNALYRSKGFKAAWLNNDNRTWAMKYPEQVIGVTSKNGEGRPVTVIFWYAGRYKVVLETSAEKELNLNDIVDMIDLQKLPLR